MRYNHIKQNKGFTLMEMLVVVLIMVILVAMAVPMYERAVEKSRRAEVSSVLKQLSDAKQRSLDAMDVSFRMGCTTACLVNSEQLDVQIPSSQEFTYGLCPTSVPLGVCAVRSRGDNSGTMFLYLSDIIGMVSYPLETLPNV